MRNVEILLDNPVALLLMMFFAFLVVWLPLQSLFFNKRKRHNANGHR